MKTLPLAAAAALLVGVTPQSSQAFSFSFVEDLLDGIGVSVDLPGLDLNLPPRAEQAVGNALSRAESALQRVFGDNDLLGGIDLPDFDLPNIDLPQVNVPNVDQIIEDALGSGQSAIDRALAEFDSVLDNRHLGDTSQIVEDALGRAQSEVDRALDRAGSILDDIDLPGSLPDVEGIVEDALGRAGSVVEDALGGLDGVLGDLENVLEGVDLGGVGGVLDDLLGDAGGVLDDLLGDTDPLDGILSNVAANLPPVALRAVERVFGGSVLSVLPVQSGAAIPEPASAGLLSLGLLAAAWRRR